MQRMIRPPSVGALPAPLRRGAESVARVLRAAGHGVWLVGGAVRDLALGSTPEDADLTTDAHPDALEALFPHTRAVGKAFGTILVRVEGLSLEVTTFRAEEGYSDGRRPDRVRYGASLEEDAARRDFTCNALYLDPLDDRFADPTGGLEDLRRGVLACVGDPAARFAEDGLRLLRLARFAAALELEVEPSTLEAARAERERIVGVSAERIHHELERMAHLSRAARAYGLLDALGLLQRFLPSTAADREALARLGPAPGLVRTWGTLLAGLAAEDAERALAAASALRPPRRDLRRLGALWALLDRLEGLLADPGAPASARVRAYREELWDDACAVWRARAGAAPAARGAAERLASLEAERAALGPAGLHPAPWIGSDDLRARGVAAGPRFGALLAEAETLQLDGVHTDRDQALGWLDARLASQG